MSLKIKILGALLFLALVAGMTYYVTWRMTQGTETRIQSMLAEQASRELAMQEIQLDLAQLTIEIDMLKVERAELLLEVSQARASVADVKSITLQHQHTLYVPASASELQSRFQQLTFPPPAMQLEARR